MYVENLDDKNNLNVFILSGENVNVNCFIISRDSLDS